MAPKCLQAERGQAEGVGLCKDATCCARTQRHPARVVHVYHILVYHLGVLRTAVRTCAVHMCVKHILVYRQVALM